MFGPGAGAGVVVVGNGLEWGERLLGSFGFKILEMRSDSSCDRVWDDGRLWILLGLDFGMEERSLPSWSNFSCFWTCGPIPPPFTAAAICSSVTSASIPMFSVWVWIWVILGVSWHLSAYRMRRPLTQPT